MEGNISSQVNDGDRKPTGVIYDMRMVEHRCLWDEGYPEKPGRFTAIIQRCHELGLFDRCRSLPPRFATEEELKKIHTQEHIEKLRQICESGISEAKEADLEKLEYESSLFDYVYFHPSTYDLSLLATGCTIDLVNAVLNEELQNGMAIIRPPGHHAMKSEFCGYCYFNNVAIAAKNALDSGKASKILIVDFDVHHGQATQQAFYNDNRVLYFSTHRFDHGQFWPNLEESNYNFIGAGDGIGYNINIPLNKAGLGNSDYLSVWHNILLPAAYQVFTDLTSPLSLIQMKSQSLSNIMNKVSISSTLFEQFNPDLVIVSAGYDAAVGCFEGEMDVTPQCYPHLLRPLMGLAGGKVAVILEGGYCLQSLAEGASLTLRALLGDPCPVIDPLTEPDQTLVDTVLNSAYMLQNQWKNLSKVRYVQEEETLQDESLHIPTIKFDWTEPKLTIHPTRDCYPIQSEELKKAIKERLDNLTRTTSLAKAPMQLCVVNADARIQFDSRGSKTSSDRFVTLEKKDGSESHTKYISLGKDSNEQPDKDSVLSVIEVVETVLLGKSESGLSVVPSSGILHGIAAKYAWEKFNLKRILVLDLGMEPGSRTKEMFVNDSTVLYVSIHRKSDENEELTSPGNASASFVGVGDGEGFTVNIALNEKEMGDAEYLAALITVVLPIAYQFNPELVIVSAGFNSGEAGPVGGSKATPEGIAHITHLLTSLANGKLVLILENELVDAWTVGLVIKALLGVPLPKIKSNTFMSNSSAIDALQDVLHAHSKYWSILSPFVKCVPRFAESRIPIGKY